MNVSVSVAPSFETAYRFQQEGRFHRAAAEYARYLKRHPNNPSALNNLGNCLRSLGRDADAVGCFERALSNEPDRISSRLNLSLARLALGDYRKAWPDYEARLDGISHRRELLAYRDQQWRGQKLGDDRTLYLFGNQGLGDELQCLRFIPMVAERVKHVVLELQKPMLPLAGGLPKNVEVIARGDRIPSFQQWCEIFSLPGIFNVELTKIPPPEKPVYASNHTIERLITESRKRYRDQMHVGLVWSGNPANELNRFRACGLNHLKPLFELGRTARFFSMQKGPAACELKPEMPVVDLSPHLRDFASTATAIERLDLLVTVDTSVAHLAGILGAKSWVLLHNPADWRWTREGESTPWYPSLKLFRQKAMREWEPLIGSVKWELKQVLSHK